MTEQRKKELLVWFDLMSAYIEGTIAIIQKEPTDRQNNEKIKDLMFLNFVGTSLEKIKYNITNIEEILNEINNTPQEETK